MNIPKKPVLSHLDIIKSIKNGKLKSDIPINIPLSSGSNLKIKYHYDDGINAAATRMKLGFPLTIRKHSTVEKSLIKPNGVVYKTCYSLDNDCLEITTMSENYPEGIIAHNYKNKKPISGYIATRGGDLLWKFNGNIKNPTEEIPIAGPDDFSLTLEDITKYIRNSAK